MPIKTKLPTKLIFGFSFTVTCLFALTVQISLAAESTIYRCGPANSQWYSQIPCEEDSEQVVVEDHPMFNDSAAATPTPDADQQETAVANQASDAASKAQAFINQLEKQRSEQLAEIDREIKDLQPGEADQNDQGNEQGDAASADMLATSLASLQSTRQSIVSEYDAMISAARKRTDTP